MSIFREHTARARYGRGSSGVEWWVQVREAHPDAGARSLRSRAARLSIGMHWDKDEDLVDQQGINIHPLLSTVTYLSDAGAPTLVSQAEACRVVGFMCIVHACPVCAVIYPGCALAMHPCVNASELGCAPATLCPRAPAPMHLDALAGLCVPMGSTRQLMGNVPLHH